MPAPPFPPQLASVTVDLGGRPFHPFDPSDRAFRARVDFDLGRLGQLLNLIERTSRPGAALDLGAAPYILTAALLERGFAVTANGLPIGGYPTDGTLRIAYRDGNARSARLTLSDVEEPFPLPSESFDVVVAGEIFEHLYRRPWALLSEAWRCLRPGGHLYLTTPNGLCVDKLLDWIRRDSTGMGFNPEAPSIRHAREYGPEEVRAVVLSQGFDVKAIVTRNYSHIGAGGFPGLLGPVKKVVYRGLHRLSERESGFLHDRGQIIFLVASRGASPPTSPPDFMLYGIGDERTGHNFAGTSRDLSDSANDRAPDS